MTTEISEEQRDLLLQNLVIPPRPSILDELEALRADPESTLQQVSDLIASDPALSIAMLKAANSPVVGQGRKIRSVTQAINLLGINNVASLISGLVLRTRLTQDAPLAIEQFWEQAVQMAMITRTLSEQIGQVPDETQSYALFHGCGIAIMLMRYPGYPRTLQLMEMATDDKVCKVEQQLHGTHHAVVGYLVARVWNMPEHFARAILLQYEPQALSAGPDALLDYDGRMMVAVTRAALHVWRTATPGREDPGWAERRSAVLNYLGMDDVEFEDWCDHMHQHMGGA
nr:HDOD domain-containing protein [Chromobacterium sp. ASV5]